MLQNINKSFMRIKMHNTYILKLPCQHKKEFQLQIFTQYPQYEE